MRVLEDRVAAELEETSGSRVELYISYSIGDLVFARHGTEHRAGPRSRAFHPLPLALLLLVHPGYPQKLGVGVFFG